MLNQKKKKIVTKITVTLSMVFVLWFFIAILFGYIFVVESRQNYLSNCKQMLEYTQQELTKQIVKVHTSLTKIDWNGGTLSTNMGLAGYESAVFVSKEGAAAVYNLEQNSLVPQNLTLTSRALRDMQVEVAKNGIYYTITNDLFLYEGAASSATEAHYIVARPAGNDCYILLSKKASAIFTEVPRFSYENMMLLIYDGKAVYDLSQNKISYDDLENIGSVSLEMLSKNTQEIFINNVNQTSKIISVSHGLAGINNVKLVAYQSVEALNTQVNNIVLKHILESVTIFIIFAFGFVVLVVMIYKNSDNVIFAKANSSYIVNINLQGKVKWANNNFRRSFDYDNITGCLNSASGDNLRNCLILGKPIVLDLVDNNGERHNIIMSTLQYYRMFRLIGSDMTDTLRDYDLLKKADTYDKNTDMPIEKMFNARVNDILAGGNGIHGIMAILRINNKSMLKSMLGEHSYGQLLTIFSGLIKKTVSALGELYYLRNGDILFFSEGTMPSKNLVDTVTGIMDNLHAPLKLKDSNLQLDVKCGIVIFDTKEKTVNADVLISNAHMALENAINNAAQSFYILYPTNFTTTRTNFTADGVVSAMINNGEVVVYFQPQMDISSKRIVGFEALTRIVGAKAKEIKISEFIENAEHYGGMLELGYYVAQKAMEFSEKIQEFNVEVSVNVSPIQLMQAGFIDKFIKLYKNYKIKDGMFNIEITESAALYNFEEVVSKLNMLQAANIGIHIDDFGVAYSSMLHLKMLPATALKIDKSLVDDIAFNSQAVFIVKNIINLARDLHLTTIAEGAEKEDQLVKLEELGCDIVQGFIIGQAVPINNAIELVKGVNKND